MSMLGANAVERPGSWQRDGDAMHVDEQFDGSSNRIRQGLAFPSLFGHCVPLSWTKLMTRTAGLLLFALCLLIIQGSFWRADSAKEIADQEATISALQLQTKQLEEGRADLAGQLADWEAKYESQKMRNAKLEEELQAMSTRLEAANATRLEGEIKIRKFVRKIKQLTRAESSDPPRLKSLSELPEVQQAMQDLIGKANSSLRPFVPRWIPAEPPSVWQQHTFKAHGMRSFIQFSAYRTGRRTFSGTGLAGAAHRTTRQLQGCTWHATNGSTTAGTLTAAYEGPLSESAIFGQWYEGIVLLCVLEGDTADTGGWLEGSVDFERFVMYREDANQTHILSPPTDQFKYQLAYCASSYHDIMVPGEVKEWMEFHRVLYNVDHFYMYNAGAIDAAFLAMLEPYKNANLVTITDMREVLIYGIKQWGQPLAIADCLHRSRMEAKWVAMADVDEYLELVPPNTLQGILAEYAETPWLTHGSYAWDMQRCTEKREGDFMAERARLREREPSCLLPAAYPDSALCLQFWGHRKYFANPRKVDFASTHEFFDSPFGKNLNVLTEVRHHHFRGLGADRVETQICTDLVKDDFNRTTHVFNDHLLPLFRLVKRCPLGSPKDCVERAWKEEAASRNR